MSEKYKVDIDTDKLTYVDAKRLLTDYSVSHYAVIDFIPMGHRNGKCNICGAEIENKVILQHKKTRKMLEICTCCAWDRLELEPEEIQEFMLYIQRIRKFRELDEWKDKHPKTVKALQRLERYNIKSYSIYYNKVKHSPLTSTECRLLQRVNINKIIYDFIQESRRRGESKRAKIDKRKTDYNRITKNLVTLLQIYPEHSDLIKLSKKLMDGELQYTDLLYVETLTNKHYYSENVLRDIELTDRWDNCHLTLLSALYLGVRNNGIYFISDDMDIIKYLYENQFNMKSEKVKKQLYEIAFKYKRRIEKYMYSSDDVKYKNDWKMYKKVYNIFIF